MAGYADIPVERLRQIFDYDPTSGVIRRNGRVVGAKERDGYRRVRISGLRAPAHRLAWALHFGSWPAQPIDHVNCRRDDNRIVNLRQCTPRQNSQNRRGPASNNTTGYLGVSFLARTGRYRAQIMGGGRQYHLGYFATAEDARDARLRAKRRIHETGNL